MEQKIDVFSGDTGELVGEFTIDAQSPNENWRDFSIRADRGFSVFCSDNGLNEMDHSWEEQPPNTTLDDTRPNILIEVMDGMVTNVYWLVAESAVLGAEPVVTYIDFDGMGDENAIVYGKRVDYEDIVYQLIEQSKAKGWTVTELM